MGCFHGDLDRGIPVPGGPTSSTPAGDLAPRSRNLFGFFRNCTSSMISDLTWSMPAMSLNVMLASLPVIFSRRAPPNSLHKIIFHLIGYESHGKNTA